VKAASLDWSDPAAVREWIADVRVALDDAHGVALDMLATPRRRMLGHHQHRRIYTAARGKLAELLAYACPPEPEGEGERGDPAGVGGAGGE
jgi:hypothetical protein